MKPTTRLFVANLPEDLKDEELVAAFCAFGKVTNIDLNIKTEAGKEYTKFAFVSLSAPRADVESCIQHFTNEDFHGTRLYVTIARESFLEKLQREKNEAEEKDDKVKFMCQESLHQKNHVRSLSHNINSEKLNRSGKWSWRASQYCQFMHQPNIVQIPINLREQLNPLKRKIEQYETTKSALKPIKHKEGKVLNEVAKKKYSTGRNNKLKTTRFVNNNRKKLEAKKKLLASMKQKRQNFKDKETITTSVISAQEELQNKRVIFPNFDDLQKKLQENEKKVSRQVTIHWIRVYHNTRILHRHKQDLMHSHLSLTSVL